MKKEAEFAPKCARIVELQEIARSVDNELKTLKAELLKAMHAEGLDADRVGDFMVSVTHVTDGLTVDSAKLKLDGLYEKYAKKRAAYDKIDVRRSRRAEIPEGNLGFANV